MDELEVASRRSAARRWLRSGAQAVLSREGRAMSAQEICRCLTADLQATEEAAVPPADSDHTASPSANGCLRLLQRTRLEDGPAILVRLLGRSLTFYRYPDNRFGLAEWPASLHLRHCDAALHRAAEERDAAGLERAALAIKDHCADPLVRGVYDRIVTELRRRAREPRR
ncbi:MAG TPA: hypothetical protein VFJ58_05015 [Armatimonadota bacterium]|nr:hypothetical protein [Armatimonadota bacterium]